MGRPPRQTDRNPRLETRLGELADEILEADEHADALRAERDGLLLRALRDGWTQQEAADHAGVTRQWVSQLAREL